MPSDRPASRSVGETEVTVLRRMMPSDANPAGNVFGGTIMKIVDEVAGIVAQRHARMNVVTARMHEMDFLAPVMVGDVLTLTGALIYVGHSSMDVRVEISAENLGTGEHVLTGIAWLTLVALDSRGRPTHVKTKVEPRNDIERAWAKEAQERREREAAARKAK
ncbi:MAG: acyl-CoA thioesterase [Thermoplasmatota archaeon]